MSITLSIREIIYVIVGFSALIVGLYRLKIVAGGVGAIADSIQRLNDQLVEVIRGLDKLEYKLESTETRIEGIEKMMEGVEKRMGNIENKVDNPRQVISVREEHVVGVVQGGVGQRMLKADSPSEEGNKD